VSAPRVCVLLPVRDGMQTLPEAVASLQAQSMEDFECLLVDDGSTDGTDQWLQRLAQEDRRMRPLFPGRVGLVGALQAGLDACRAPLVARMDADDLCLPRRLELQARRLETRPDLGLVSCRVRYGGDALRQAGYAHYVSWTNSLLDHDRISLARFRESPLPHPSVMFRRELAHLHGSYREGAFPEDYELWLRWLEAGVRMEKLAEELLVWNDPPGRLSRTDPRYDMQRFYETKAAYLARWLARHNPWHPHVSVLGAGRVSRKRAELLCRHGIAIDAWYDIDPRKVGKTIPGQGRPRPVLHREQTPPPGQAFLLSYVASRLAGEEIAAFLATRGHVEGRDFLLAA